ncbi:zinc finger with ufm1-specific peptidase domain protein [Quercus suber]|uniref:Zinc finger with ufm1-specific peptidase domain protein n=1 Tax=Quercus suber TaxID=58331 RepID=A0AAW0IT64_QUESU
MTAPCPFCDVTVPWAELESRHANSHFELEDEQQKQKRLATDRDLAQQIALAPSSPHSHANNLVMDDMSCELSCDDAVSKINDRGKREVVQVYGPMDKYILGRKYDAPLAGSRGDENSRYSSMQLGNNLGGGSGDNFLNKCARKNKGLEVLVHWVWNYFSDESLSKSGHHRVAVSEKPPLYFQHDGHSRTVVGVQVKHQQNGTQQFSLLILDPAHRTAALKTSLKENDGWQKLIKRGVHTLKKPQYQLCYIDPGIASEGEMELLKRIDSIFLEF